MKAMQLKPDFYWTGVLDRDLRVFDIIMMTEFGTTYNSYLLKCGDKTVLFETAKEKFFDDYLETSQGGQIKYLDHTGAPEAVFALAEGEQAVAAYEYCNLHGLWKAEI